MKVCPVCDKEFADDGFVRCDRIDCPADVSRLISIQSRTQKTDPLVGAMLTDRIRIDARIGEGGMGAVYKGEDVLLGRTVAVKVLHPQFSSGVEEIKRFFNEAKVVARLRHPNTIQVFDYGQSTGGMYYIAMEFMTGEPLDDYLQKNRLTLGRVIEIAEQVCLSLEEAHAAGIVHRDLKPDNIFIDTVNNRRIVKVIDFGIAKLVTGGENLTQAGMVFGTPTYMSPEQAQAKALDGRSDIYSLGCVLFAMLAGRTPFIGESPMDIVVQHVTRPAPSVEQFSVFGALPPALVALVGAMLAKDPAERPQSIADVRRVLVDVGRNAPGLRNEATHASGALLAVGSGPTAASALSTATTVAGAVGGVTPAAPRAGFAPHPADDTGSAPARRGLLPVVAGVVGLLAVAGVVLVMVVAKLGGEDDAAAVTSAPAPVATATTPPGSGAGEGVAAAAPAALTPQAALGASQAVRTAVVAAGVDARDATVTLTIDSVPSGASVLRADTGAVLGVTPLQWSTRRIEAGSLALRVELEGHTPFTGSASLAASSTVSARLERATTRGTAPARVRTETVEEPAAAEPAEGTGARRRFVPRDPVTIPSGN